MYVKFLFHTARWTEYIIAVCQQMCLRPDWALWADISSHMDLLLSVSEMPPSSALGLSPANCMDRMRINTSVLNIVPNQVQISAKRMKFCRIRRSQNGHWWGGIYQCISIHSMCTVISVLFTACNRCAHRTAGFVMNIAWVLIISWEFICNLRNGCVLRMSPSAEPLQWGIYFIPPSSFKAVTSGGHVCQATLSHRLSPSLCLYTV